MVAAVPHQSIPLLWRGGKHKHFVMFAFSNHVEVLHSVTPIDLLVQSAVLSDGVVVAVLHQIIPLLWRGGKHKHFVMSAFSNHVEVLHSVTPIDLLVQSAVLSDGVVAAVLHQIIPLLWRGGKHKHFVMSAFSNHVEVLYSVTPIDLLVQSAVLSDGVVAAVLHQIIPLLWRGIPLFQQPHALSIGLALCPDSPPTITQCMPSKFIVPKSSNRGSADKNLCCVAISHSIGILGKPYFLSSTETPSHILGGTSRHAKYRAIR